MHGTHCPRTLRNRNRVGRLGVTKPQLVADYARVLPVAAPSAPHFEQSWRSQCVSARQTTERKKQGFLEAGQREQRVRMRARLRAQRMRLLALEPQRLAP